jgi:hypothetical protein
VPWQILGYERPTRQRNSVEFRENTENANNRHSKAEWGINRITPNTTSIGSVSKQGLSSPNATPPLHPVRWGGLGPSRFPSHPWAA